MGSTLKTNQVAKEGRKNGSTMRKTLIDRLDEGQDLEKAAKNLLQSAKKWRARVKRKTEQILEYEDKYFVTFTFNDKGLETTQQMHLKKIRKALAEASLWILNEDFGTQTGRLHYHALVSYDQQLNYNDLISLWPYGSVNIIPIHTPNAKSLRLYLMKLSQHATKGSAKKIWFSRIKYDNTHDEQLDYNCITNALQETQKKYAKAKKEIIKHGKHTTFISKDKFSAQEKEKRRRLSTITSNNA